MTELEIMTKSVSFYSKQIVRTKISITEGEYEEKVGKNIIGYFRYKKRMCRKRIDKILNKGVH